MCNMDGKYYEYLDKNIWITKHCRHIAANRIKNIDKLSQWVISLSSVLVILLSVSPYFNIFSINTDNINFYVLFLSVLILAISQLESGKNYSVVSERLYNCANECGNLLREIKLSKAENDQDGIKAVGEKYSALMESVKENHLTIDYDLFISKYPKNFELGIRDVITKKVKYFLFAYWFYLALFALAIFASYFFCMQS